jgi:hypothetical protein
MSRKILMLVLAVTMVSTVLVSAGCGGNKAGSIDESTYSKINNGMTMDDVDAVAGQPERSHSIGAAASPQVFWYYGKTDGEGFVRVVFEDGKVTTVSPYDESITPES